MFKRSEGILFRPKNLGIEKEIERTKKITRK
jgi:hypothetical protein